MTSRIRLFALALATLVGTQGLAYGQSKEFEQTVDLAAGGRFRLEGSKGDIEVIAWDQPRVEVKARIEAPRDVSADYARRAVEATTVDVRVSDGSVSIRSNYDDVPYRERSWGGQSRSVPFVHYQIRAPQQIDMRVEADRGDTHIEGFDGTIDLETDRGTLEAAQLSGDVRIEVDRGDRSRLSSIHGSLDLEADRTDVTIRDLRLDGDSRLDVDRGDIELEVPPTQAISLYADMSRRANFESDFDITLRRRSSRVLEGTINGGGPELMIDADRSTIRLRRGM